MLWACGGNAFLSKFVEEHVQAQFFQIFALAVLRSHEWSSIIAEKYEKQNVITGLRVGV